MQNLSLDQYDLGPEWKPEDFLVEDAIETRSEPTSTQGSHAYDVEDIQDAIPTRQSSLHDGQGVLPLLRLADFSEDIEYDEHPPTCIHYSIEWKLTVNSKGVAKDTEPNLVLAPAISG